MTNAIDNPETDRLFRALRDVPTPALVVDEEALDRNIAAMAELVRSSRRSLRPHAKTHKSVVIARKQIAAGAIGVCCATVPELEAMAGSGIGGLLLTAPVQDRAKAGTLAGIAKRTPITIAVDHPSQIAMLAGALPADSAPIGVIVDVDVGQKRTGVSAVADTVAIAKRIGEEKRFKFSGLQGYAGHVQHIAGYEERSREAVRVSALLGEHIAALRAHGFEVAIVSGSGTGTHAIDLTHQPFTEIQAGSYVFMDADYARIQSHDGSLPYACSLLMLTTVVSANIPGQVTVDAGTKSLAVNGPPPHLIFGAPEGTAFQFAGDEHGILRLPEGSKAPALGDRILMSVTHCDPTVNLFSVMHAVTKSGNVETWPVVGRN